MGRLHACDRSCLVHVRRSGGNLPAEQYGRTEAKTMRTLTADRVMHGLRLHQRGGPDSLSFEEMPLPVVAIGDVLVRVHAASFTPTELNWPATWVDRSGRDRLPVVPGHEVSGVVAALGFGTTGVTVGEEVYGLPDWYRDGAAAEYVAVEARNLAPKPASVSHTQAAAVPLAGLTSWQALFVHGGLTEGQTVLIHGAGGGVGTYAVQLAHMAGARVIATGHAWARDGVRELGADDFIDVDQQHFEQRANAVDLVVDLVGGEVLQRSWSVVKPGGVVVSVVDPIEASTAARADARGIYFVVEPDRAQLTQLARRIDAHALRPVVGRVFKLAEGRAAFAAKQGHGLPGKVVWQVAAADAGS
jgi:NADPH:quinone reductase-like Zn-dependent oxidoreductase